MSLVAKLKDNKELERFLKFAVVGAVGALVDFSVFNFFDLVFELKTELSSGISFIAAVSSNFILNRFWTFPDSRSRSVWAQLGQYLSVNVVGLLIRFVIMRFATQPVITLFEELALSLPLSPESLGKNALLAIVIIIVLFWNFFINRYWTYNDVE